LQPKATIALGDSLKNTAVTLKHNENAQEIVQASSLTVSPECKGQNLGWIHVPFI